MLLAQNGAWPLCSRLIDRSTIGAFHVDHIIPFKYGGGYENDNLQIVHPLCNLKKGDFVQLEDLIPYLEERAREFG
jgi:5-methylcytosine-specific restriction endonuclease McrA